MVLVYNIDITHSSPRSLLISDFSANGIYQILIQLKDLGECIVFSKIARKTKYRIKWELLTMLLNIRSRILALNRRSIKSLRDSNIYVFSAIENKRLVSFCVPQFTFS